MLFAPLCFCAFQERLFAVWTWRIAFKSIVLQICCMKRVPQTVIYGICSLFLVKSCSTSKFELQTGKNGNHFVLSCQNACICLFFGMSSFKTPLFAVVFALWNLHKIPTKKSSNSHEMRRIQHAATRRRSGVPRLSSTLFPDMLPPLHDHSVSIRLSQPD